jgi:hypothetical protein
MTAHELFKLHKDEFGKFERVENKMSNRRDLHVYLMLDKIFPMKDDETINCIIDWATVGEIGLFPTTEQIETLTSDQIRDLVRCKVTFIDGDFLAMSVY